MGNVLSHSHSGLTPDTTISYQVRAVNNAGNADWSNADAGSTLEDTAGSVNLSDSVTVDAITITPVVSITAGEPTPTVSKLELYVDGTLEQTITVSQAIAQGASYTFSDITYTFTDESSHTFLVTATVSNWDSTTITISGSVIGDAEYIPQYNSKGYAYTHERTTDQLTLDMTVDREMPGSWSLQCNFAPGSDITNKSWNNQTSIVTFIGQESVSADENVYIECYDGNHVFSTVSYSEDIELIALGTSSFDEMFGDFLGVPLAVFFVVLVGGLATGRSAPTFIIIIIATIGIAGAIGFFTVEEGIWGLILIAGAVGVLVGKKLF